MNQFLDLLARGVVVADGGIGSLIAAHFFHDPPQRAARRIIDANRDHAELVERIHHDFLEAGARLITTNSFSLNRTKLIAAGAEPDVAGWNGAAVKIARNARDTRPDVAIGGSIGPLDPDYLLQYAPSVADRAELVREQAQALEERGVDLFVLETFTVLDELLAAVDSVQAVSALPILASFTIDDTGLLAGAVPPEDAATALAARGVAAIGVNCSVGPLDTLDALTRVASAVPGHALSVMPNAGFAQRVGGRVLYPAPSADTFRAFARDAIALGARVVGGCCGTTPDDIRAIATGVRNGEPSAAGRRVWVEAGGREAPARPTSPPSAFAQRLASGEFIVSVQIDPPKQRDAQSTLETVDALAASGLVHVIDINSKSGGTVYQDALVMALGVQASGIDAMPHLTPRDATVYGIASQLLAATAWGGLRTVLVVSGDAPAGGAYPETGGVFRVDSIGLVRGIAQEGLPLTIGVAVNHNADDMAVEMDRLEKKLAAGAQFVMTQPVFSVPELEGFTRDIASRFPGVPFLVGVWPLVSHAQALRINERVPGVVVDDETVRRLGAAGAQARAVGFTLARDVLDATRTSCAGAYVIAPFKRPREALEILSPQAVRSGDPLA